MRPFLMCIIGGALAFTSGCDFDQLAVPAPDVEASILLRAVTGDVTRHVNASGHFILPQPTHYPDDIISPDRARSIALAYVKTFHRDVTNGASRRVGTDGELNVIRGPYYAESPYEDLGLDVHNGFRNAYGPYYVMILGIRQAPHLVVAVSAHATAATIDQSGWLSLDAYGGGEVLTHDIRSRGILAAFAPEQAAIRVAERLGTSVRSVPELVLQGRPFGPVSPVWRIRIADRVQRQVDGVGFDSDVVHVDVHGGRIKMSRSRSEYSETVPVLRIGYRPGGLVDQAKLRLKPGFVVDLVDVDN